MNRTPRPHRAALAAAVAAAFAAAPALAAEPGAPGGPFEGNVGNALWTLVIFGLVVWVLGKFAWKPILKGLNDRETFIRAALEQAKRDREEAAERLREYHDKLVTARSEATAIVDEARRDADLARRQIEEEAKAEARAAIERARREIALAQESATKELYSLAARLSTSVAARVLEREIDPADHERLIRDSIARLGRPEN
jgi:F-type H+-transporting ATPase subunit b